jgi:hypothetical protein
MYFLGLDAVEEAVAETQEKLSPKDVYEIRVKEEQRALQKIALVSQITLAVVSVFMLYITFRNGGKK